MFKRKNDASEIQLNIKKDRVWEVDALRGLLALCVVLHHLYLTVDQFCIKGIYTNLDPDWYINFSDPLHFWFDYDENGNIIKVFAKGFLDNWSLLGRYTFFWVSGISTAFTRDNFNRGVKMLLAAYATTAYSLIMVWLTGNDGLFIRFGLIHCYAYTMLLYCLLAKLKPKIILLLGNIIVIVGVVLSNLDIYSNYPWLYMFGINEYNVATQQYYPLFPFMGFFLIGVFVGSKLYKEKKTIFPNFNHGFLKPLEIMGKYSGLIYMSHLVIYPLVFYLIGVIFNLF